MMSNGSETVSKSTRLKRRQSDARWRANVATCFETLRHVIPVNRRASKRQISKACVLHEASQHIRFLEDILGKLLTEKGKAEGEDNVEQFCNEQLMLIKQAFEEKQCREIGRRNFSSNTASPVYIFRERKRSETSHRERVEKSRSSGKSGPKIAVTSVTDNLTPGGRVKTITLRTIDQHNDDDYEFLGYGCGSDIEREVLKRVTKHKQGTRPNRKTKVSKKKREKKSPPRTTTQTEKEILVADTSQCCSSSPETTNQLSSPHRFSWDSSDSSSLLTELGLDNPAWTEHDLVSSELGCTEAASQAESTASFLGESLLTCSPPDAEESSELSRAQAYTTPLKQKTRKPTGFTPVRLPHCVASFQQDEDDVASVTSLICDEDLPVSDGEEEFIESRRSKYGSLKRDIFNVSTPGPTRRKPHHVKTSQGRTGLNCRRSLEWYGLSGSDAGDSAADETDVLPWLPANRTSNEFVKNLDVFSSEREFGEDGQGRIAEEPEYLHCGRVFEQIFSGNQFVQRFDNHINQLDTLQKEIFKLEQHPDLLPVGTISSGCDVDDSLY